MNTSEERFEEKFLQLLLESDEESEGHGQDESAEESQRQDEDPDFESESESGDEPEMSWSTTTSTHDRWISTRDKGTLEKAEHMVIGWSNVLGVRLMNSLGPSEACAFLTVRHRAKVILDLLNDDDKLRAQRKKMKSDNKDRYQGYTSNDMRMGCVAANNCSYIDNYGDEWKGDISGNYMNKSAYDSSRSDPSSKEVNSFQFSDETRIGSTSPELGFRQEPAPDEDFGEFVWAHPDVRPIAITQAIVSILSEIARTGAPDIPALPPPVPLFASTGTKSSASVNLIGLDTAEVQLSPIRPVLHLSDGGMESSEKSAPSNAFFESYSSARIKPDVAFREDWTTTRTLLESSGPKSSFDYTISDSFSAPTPLPLMTSTPLFSSAHVSSLFGDHGIILLYLMVSARKL
ncbi:unnamed protein product [Haemonchus placei]|uniref:Clathrin_bdg domain-containing protein n=1 Tax=Haemonchus placei TaxID=6290 RepID=A0A0N4WGL6_HAEPC|nr:unnamed protein product [Haemonchus placei]